MPSQQSGTCLRTGDRRAGDRHQAWVLGVRRPRAISSVFDISAVWLGVVLLSSLATSEEAGIYTAVGRVVIAATLLQLAIRLAVAPEISRLLALGDLPQASHLHRVSTRWIVLFSWPLLALLTSFPGTVLSLFGPEFDQGPARWCCSVSPRRSTSGWETPRPCCSWRARAPGIWRSPGSRSRCS
ncbi:hypothetical protein WKI71_26540 [Streptomyces sp. MS1.AVA.1]|uniref:Oligosaccharide flippase family protein n=1 Tax=Streptomyces machairae TaxID=3134109 RepID=A0ABU8UP45_9ACTN